MHLGESGPSAAPCLALPDSPVLYGGVVHWAETTNLWSSGHHVSWNMVSRSLCFMANGRQVLMYHGMLNSRSSCDMANGQQVIICHGIWYLSKIYLPHNLQCRHCGHQFWKQPHADNENEEEND